MQMDADKILGMTSRDAAALFPGKDQDVRKGFAKLAAKWHPDVCSDPRAEDVFTHILSLRGRVSDKEKPALNQRIFKTNRGKPFKSSPVAERLVDQGEILVGSRTLSTIFSREFGDLAEKEGSAPSLFRFENEEMKRQMEPFLPTMLRSVALAEDEHMVIVQKSRDEVLLADLLAKEGRMPDVHAAWLCSGLLNICAWLGYAKLVHGAISPEHILVDPAKHSVRLAAGWAFATPNGDRPLALPSRTIALLPRMAVKAQTIDATVDLEMVRQTIREALGDPRGTSGGVSTLPAPLKTWINMPSAKTAVEDYQSWQSALEAGWGQRRFVDYPIRAADIYAG